jgi:hypothetical protein
MLNSITTDNIEVVNELHNIIIGLNNYCATPDETHFVELVPDEIKERYGVDRIKEVAGVMFEKYETGVTEPTRVLSKRLTELFQVFNERYFRGNLPAYTIEVGYVTLNYGSVIASNTRVLFMLATSEPQMIARMLRDMARISGDNKCTHGLNTPETNEIDFKECDECWGDELNRIYKAGAPLAVPEELRLSSADAFIAEATGQLCPDHHDEGRFIFLWPTNDRR